MTISIWRYSHFAVACLTAVFISIASITGAILSFESMYNTSVAFNVQDWKKISVAEVLNTFKEKDITVTQLDIEASGALKASVLENNSEKTYYFDPSTAKKIGVPIKRHSYFKFIASLHRSLFLKKTGRILITITCFFLLIIIITGIILLQKRQGKGNILFSKINQTSNAVFYHILLSRIFIIPLIVIAVSGTYISFDKFSLLPKTKLITKIASKHNSITNSSDEFPIFKKTQLAEVQKLVFPFSESEEDYFELKTVDKEFLIHQYSGSILQETHTPYYYSTLQRANILHTGKNTFIWASILLLSCLSLLYFLFSGFLIAFRRFKLQPKKTAFYAPSKAKYIVLVGSEMGSTFNYAIQFSNALASNHNAVAIDSLNSYRNYPNASHIIVFTSTYGNGVAPSNASLFEKRFNSIIQKNEILFSVVGFGSTNYPNYCLFAEKIHQLMKSKPNFSPLIPMVKINQQSNTLFKQWVSLWNQNTHIPIDISLPSINTITNQKQFSIIERTNLDTNNTFLIRMKPCKKLSFKSGDLLSIVSEKDGKQRLYSISRINDEILLSVKKHPFGICSNFLSSLSAKDTLVASIKRNYQFHFPKRTKEIIMISNGTGIAPFLGMLHENHKKIKTHLFWGGKNKKALEIYNPFILDALKSKKLNNIYTAYSREITTEKLYIQDVVKKQNRLIANVLINDGIILICGSLKMQQGVLEAINYSTTTRLQLPLSVFEKSKQIKMDCY